MSGTAAPEAADLVVTCDRIRTFDERSSVARALAVRDGVVVAVGDEAALEPWVAARTARLDLDAGALLPGFCDTHMHFEKIATELAMLDLAEATSLDEVLDAVAAAASRTAVGEWIQSFGDDNAWHEERLAERRLPTRAELDAVVPDHPVYLYRRPDAAALNSAAVAALSGQLDGEPGWDGATGTIHSPLARDLQERLPPPADQLTLVGRASEQLLSYGITTIVDPGLPATFDHTWSLYRRAKVHGVVAQRLFLMDRFDYNRPFDAELARVHARTVGPDAFDGDLHAWGLKLLLDGEFENAWMRDGDVQRTTPTRRYSTSELAEVLALCARKRWPVCFHVMGGGAVDAVVDAVRSSVDAGARFERGQVALAHAFHASRASLESCRALGIAISVQPLLAYCFEREMVEAWDDLAHAANPYKTMFELGVEVAGGSDVLPCEPLRGAAVAVTRRCRLGTTLGPDEALSPEQAVRLFTSGAGGYLRWPKLGTLAVGAPADFAWWREDPLDLQVEQWPDQRAALVAVGGKVVAAADDLDAPLMRKETV